MSADYHFTESQLRAMTKAELVALGVLHPAVAANLGDFGTYQQAWAGGHLQCIPIDYNWLAADAASNTPPGASVREIVGVAMRLSGGRADLTHVERAVRQVVQP